MTENRILIFTKNLEILWDDMDAYGHVNNAKYFTYMQECRFDWLRQTGITFDPSLISPVLAATSCKFVRPIVYPAKIAIDMFFSGRKGKKILFEHTIRNEANPEQIYAIGEATIVWYDLATGRGIAEPQQFHNLLPELLIAP